MLGFCLFVYRKYIYYALKWIVHIMTGKCAIERSLESSSGIGYKIFALDEQCRRSKSILNKLVDAFDFDKTKTLTQLQTLTSIGGVMDLQSESDVLASILSVKVIVHQNNMPVLKRAVSTMTSYRKLLRVTEASRIEKWDEENQSQIDLLRRLWKSLNLNSDIEFRRKGRHWQSLGFQGEDPATDLRGMGLLGLKNLVAIAEAEQSIARSMLSGSSHPNKGYSFAITGIDMTSLCYKLLLFGALKNLFYFQSNEIGDDLKFFHECYVEVFRSFDKFWFDSNPSSIMDYGRIRQLFEYRLMRNIQEKRKIVA